MSGGESWGRTCAGDWSVEGRGGREGMDRDGLAMNEQEADERTDGSETRDRCWSGAGVEVLHRGGRHTVNRWPPDYTMAGQTDPPTD